MTSGVTSDAAQPALAAGRTRRSLRSFSRPPPNGSRVASSARRARANKAMKRTGAGVVSLDIFVQDIPAGVENVEEIPEDLVPQPIGARSAIIVGILRAAPEVDFTRPDWGTIEAEDYSIEINIGVEDPVTGFAFHLRGGQRGLFQVADILEELDVRAFAPESESGLFEVDRGSEAFARWRSYRDRVVQR
jgi:hypothetical protein